MRLPFVGRERPDVAVRRGERLLAWTDTSQGPVGGTREALYLPGCRIPWELVEAATWDVDTGELVVREVGTWGEVRPVHRFSVAEPGRLLQLVRERVTASIVLQRHVPVDGRRGVRVVARRAPTGDRALSWVYEFDEGVDPDDPAVRAAADQALVAARAEVETG
ncbi:hypothetical protein [Nocardioides sp. SYSU DS0663]|uniref:hypothetical protein n=1 Tax=Nocardioides sp. SYSU DS0663 TaxID=3416445 RepID=UPI003F4C6523